MRTEEARAREVLDEVAWLEGRMEDGESRGESRGETRGELVKEAAREEVRRVRVGVVEEGLRLEVSRVLLRSNPPEHGLVTSALPVLRIVACEEAKGCWFRRGLMEEEEEADDRVRWCDGRGRGGGRGGGESDILRVVYRDMKSCRASTTRVSDVLRSLSIRSQMLLGGTWGPVILSRSPRL